MFARSAGKRLAVGAATLATGFGLLLSIAPAASACTTHTPWGPWNDWSTQGTVVAGMPFRHHHCLPLFEQSAPTAVLVPVAETAPVRHELWHHHAVPPLAEHVARHHGRRHHGRRHHGRRHHLVSRHAVRYNNAGYQAVRYHLGSALYRTDAPRALAAMVPAHRLGFVHPAADFRDRHYGARHHHHRHHLRRHHHWLHRG